jgi:Rrf2 family protein
LVLRRAGLVSGVRGAQGGYVLSRPAAEITVGDIIRALEGPVAPVACVADPEFCTRDGALGTACPTRPVWVKLAQCMSRVLDSISLSDLVIVSAEERAALAGTCACDDCTTLLGRHGHG